MITKLFLHKVSFHRLIDTQHIVAAFCLTQDDFNLADNMLEEMKIISMDQCKKLVGIGTPIPRLEIQTGVDFRDCDLLGKILQLQSTCIAEAEHYGI